MAACQTKRAQKFTHKFQIFHFNFVSSFFKNFYSQDFKIDT